MTDAKTSKTEAPKTHADSAEAADAIKVAERQDAIGAELRGGIDKKTADLDAEFKKNWQDQQKKAYPEVYRRAEAVRGQPPSAQSGAPLWLGGAVSLQPGHDPSKQEEYNEDVEHDRAGADTAGSDNLAPHETTGGGGALATAVVRDSSVTP